VLVPLLEPEIGQEMVAPEGLVSVVADSNNCRESLICAYADRNETVYFGLDSTCHARSVGPRITRPISITLNYASSRFA
jgi:hypothetical protein